MFLQLAQLQQNVDTVFAESRTSVLSLAVRLTDDFTGQPRPIGIVRVSLREHNRPAIQNPSGYFLFTDMAANTYTLLVSSEYYFPVEREVSLPFADTLNPVVNVRLKPQPYYPFPPRSTLLKGLVTDTGGNFVSDAEVAILEKGLVNQTTDQGEFILYFTGLTEDDIMVVSGRQLIKGNGSPRMTLEVTHPQYRRRRVQIEVEAEQINGIVISNLQPK